ncbi:hypothetical protein A4G19_03685 [Pasteurellaceae bacterium Macca]|nr:hypothetical protein [Pasteurellaceae bacterium Macca]
MSYIALAIVGIFLAVIGWAVFRVKQASREIDHLLKVTEQLEAENQQIANEKAVAETQVKHHQVRQRNEENTRGISHQHVIDRLQQQGDLRD